VLVAHDFCFDGLVNLCVAVFLRSPWGGPTGWSGYGWSLQCVLSSFVFDILFYEENIYTHWMLVRVFICIYMYICICICMYMNKQDILQLK